MEELQAPVFVEDAEEADAYFKANKVSYRPLNEGATEKARSAVTSFLASRLWGGVQRHFREQTRDHFLWDYIPSKYQATWDDVIARLADVKSCYFVFEHSEVPAFEVDVNSIRDRNLTNADLYIIPVRDPKWIAVLTHEAFGPFLVS